MAPVSPPAAQSCSVLQKGGMPLESTQMRNPCISTQLNPAGQPCAPPDEPAVEAPVPAAAAAPEQSQGEKSPPLKQKRVPCPPFAQAQGYSAPGFLQLVAPDAGQ